MRLTWNLTAQPLYLQTTQWLGTMPWRAMSDRFMQQVSAWTQPLIKWTQKEEEPFFIKAQEEERYHHFQAWRSDVRKQMRQLQQDIVRQYRQGKLLSPEHLRAALIAQQVNFEANTVSPLYYTRHLKRLAQRLPRYAHTFDGVAAQFKDYLKAQPEEAFRYFYNDLVNQLIDGSRESLTLTAEVRTALQKAVTYYQDIVPTALYEAVQATIAAVGHAQEHYQDVVKQLNALFLQVMEAEEQAPAAVTSINALEAIQEPLTAGWNYLKAHPKILLWGATAAALGVSTLYRLSQEHSGESIGQVSMSWLGSLSPSLSLVTSSAAVSSLPLALGYFTSNFAQQKGLPFWQTAVPLMAGWLSQLTPVIAQTERWAKALGGTGDDVAMSVEQTNDGGYIVTGYTRSFGAGSYDLLLSKLTANGTVTWTKTWGGAGDDAGYYVKETTQGDYIVTGYTDTYGAASLSDLVLMKWSATGVLTWAKTLGANDEADGGTCVKVTSAGDIIVTGYTDGYGGGYQDLWISKWTSNGSLVWVRTLGGTSDDYGSSVELTTDDGYVVTGYTMSYGAGGRDLWLSKWRSDGVLLWVRTLGGTGTDGGSSLYRTTNNEFIVTGYGDFLLSEWSSSGGLNWVRDLSGSVGATGNSVHQASDGSYIIAGSTSSFGAGVSDLWFSKWTSGGTETWSRTLGGTSNDYGYSVHPTTDGGYIVAGATRSFGAGGSDIWLSKWDSQGSIGGTNCVSEPSVSGASVSFTAATPSGVSAGIPPATLLAQNSGVLAQTVSLSPLPLCNEAPTLSNGGGSFNYTENAAATVIDNNTIVVDDVDNTYLSSAQVSISSGFASGQDVLSFTNQNGIVGSYNNSTGVLTLTGTSSVAYYQAALRSSVTYRNTSNNPSTATRTFRFTVNDGLVNSNAVTRSATVIAVNDAPVMAGSSAITFIENDAPMIVNSGLTLTDDDSPNLVNATVTITANFNASQDILSCVPPTGINASYNDSTGILTLSSTSNVTNYQTALRNVRYVNTSENPSTGSRTISFQANDGASIGSLSNVLNSTVSVTAENDAPVLSNNFLAIREGERVRITSNELSATDVDNPAGSLQFIVSAVEHGNFEDAAGILITDFSQQAVVDGNVYFQHDGSEISPSYMVRVSDGQLFSQAEAATISFNDLVNDGPVLGNNRLTIAEGETVILSPAELSASDVDSNPASLVFTVSGIDHGYFASTNATSTPITQFTQQQISDRQIQFTHDGSEEEPAYAVSVSDGQISSTPADAATISFTPINDAPVVANPMADQTVVANETFIFPVPSNTFSDAENDPLTLQAQLASGEALPAWMTFDAANRRFNGTAPSVGRTRFSLFASDPLNATARTDFDIQANDGVTTSSSDKCDRNCLNEWIGISSGVASGVATLIGGSYGIFKYLQKRRAATTYEFALNELSSPHSKLSNKERRHVDHFVFVPDLDRTEAEALYSQTGIAVKFDSGATRAKVVLGQGEFGKLRIAYNLKTHEFVGVKKIKGVKAMDASQEERLIHERINGLPNVLPLLHSKVTEDSQRKPVFYQFIPLAGFGNGEKLRNQLALLKDPALKLQLLQHIAQGLLTGIANLHEKHAYHLDIKAQNMVVTMEGTIYVIDFGCAREFNPEEPAWIKDGGNGDSGCFSPERLAHFRYRYAQKGQPLGEGRETVSGYDAEKADAWSVGIVLLELLLGKHPFADASKGFANRVALWDTDFMEKQLAQRFKEVAAWTILDQAQSKALLTVIQGLLESNPMKRMSPKKALQADIFKTPVFASAEALKEYFQQLKTLLPDESLQLTEVKVVKPAEIDHTYYGAEVASVPSGEDHNYPEVYERTPLSERQVDVSSQAKAENTYEITQGEEDLSVIATVGMRK